MANQTCDRGKNPAPKAIVMVLAMLLTLAWGARSQAESPSFKRAVTERAVARLDPATFLADSFVVSPDGRRVVYAESGGGRKTVVVDGLRQKGYDDILVPDFGFDFSPDSAKVGFFARADHRWFLVMDGKEQREHLPQMGIPDAFSIARVKYSEEGARYCYVAEGAGQRYLVVDGKAAGGPYEEVFLCDFSRDGASMAYSARERRGGDIFYVVNGVKQKAYGVAKSFVFSPDGRRFAYIAYPTRAWSQRGQRELIVLDGREEKEYYKVSGVSFSPDSRQAAYMADPGTASTPKGVIILDGREIGDERAGFAGPVFSPDSRRMAYGAEVRSVSTLFSPKPLPPFSYQVIDGKPGKSYEGVSTPVFSPDSRRVAYYGRDRQTYRMIVDGQAGGIYDDIGFPVFSPDSGRVGYRARKGTARFVVVDGREYAPYESVSSPVFSPDGQRVCYVAKTFGRETVVIDDVEGPFYDEIYPRHWRKRVVHRGIGFSSPDRFYYFAKKGNELIFVEETIEPSEGAGADGRQKSAPGREN